MKKLFLFSTLALLTAFLVSCGDDDNTSKPKDDIVQLAIDNGYTSLAAALTRADLVDDLQGDGPFTVFAPTDDQFAGLLSAVGQSSLDDVPVSVLEDILLSHVVSGSFTSDELESGTVTTLGGTTLEIEVGSGITVGGLDVVNPFDVVGSNGVIHTIDGVIVPGNVAQFVDTVLEPAYFNINFTDLVSAVVKADLTTTLLTTDNLTIFAPTNDAFTAAGVNVSSTSAQDLEAVLAYHVIAGEEPVLSGDIPASAETFGGEMLYFSLISSGNFINGSTEIVDVDIESGSGVVHVIDNVLMPPSGTVVDVAVDISEDSGEFSSLVAALTRTTTEGDENLISVLSGDGPFTVFAPTNAAFQELLDSNQDWTELGDIPISTLVAVLKYHVVSARAFDKDLAGALDMNNELSTVLQQNLVFDLNNLTINTSSNITATNTLAANGVIHVIDEVLMPNF